MLSIKLGQLRSDIAGISSIFFLTPSVDEIINLIEELVGTRQKECPCLAANEDGFADQVLKFPTVQRKHRSIAVKIGHVSEG
jgi:hypothetical protein